MEEEGRFVVGVGGGSEGNATWIDLRRALQIMETGFYFWQVNLGTGGTGTVKNQSFAWQLRHKNSQPVCVHVCEPLLDNKSLGGAWRKHAHKIDTN